MNESKDVKMASGITVSVPMVSVRVMPDKVRELLRDAFRLLDQCTGHGDDDTFLEAPSDIRELREAVKRAYMGAQRIVEREDRTELARRRYIEEARK